jgi:CHAD domain-containing protein
MPVDHKRSRLAFQKLNRQLGRLSAEPAPANVHKFRTYGRRIEAMLDALVAHPNRNDRKLLKVLARLRKKAGRVRDLDVQISSLRSLKVPQEATQKSELIQALVEERREREKKLGRAFDHQTLQDLRRRLKRASTDEIPSSVDPLAIGLRQLHALARDRAPLTEKTLHRYRIVGKRARYLAELAGDTPEALRAVGLLKRMQDALGNWHDWLKLTQRGEELFGIASDSALVAALRNVTRTKFRHAVDVLAETRMSLSRSKGPSSETERKISGTLTTASAA